MRLAIFLFLLPVCIAVQSQTPGSIRYKWRSLGYVYYHPNGKRLKPLEFKRLLLNNEASKQWYTASRKHNLAAKIIQAGTAGFLLYGMQRKFEQRYAGKINPYMAAAVALIPINLIFFFKSERQKHKAVKDYNEAK